VCVCVCALQEIKDWVESTRLAQETKEHQVIFFIMFLSPAPFFCSAGAGSQQEATGNGVCV